MCCALLAEAWRTNKGVFDGWHTGRVRVYGVLLEVEPPGTVNISRIGGS